MTTKNANNIYAYFDTLGCAKNIVDTSKMKESLLLLGINFTTDINKSNCIIVNTCAFIEAASQESINTILEYKKFYPDKKLIVTGCLVSRYKEDLKKELFEPDLFLSCKEEDKLGDSLINMFEVDFVRCKKVDNVKSTKEAFRYIKISDGCNRFCSYCTIPYIRGRYRSISYEIIEKDVWNAVNDGVKEIVLVAQDCGVWGNDFENKKNLSYLLDCLAKSFSDTFFRILYVQPDAINDDLLNVMKKHENIVNYIDIPLQHVSKNLLKTMNRSGDAVKFLDMLQNIRKFLQDVTLRTTLIVGYPGETDKDFENLCIFMQKAKFDYVGVFEYSKEDGTKAAELSNQISSDIKQKRYALLRDLCDHISLKKLDNKIGNKYMVLIEGIDDGRIFGRSEFQAPEVDGYVYIDNLIKFNDKINIGSIVDVKISDNEMYDLVGELV